MIAYQPFTRDILAVFTDEVAVLGGAVSDVFDDGRCLIARAILPVTTDVRPGDTIDAGVAVRAAGSEIAVHPYTFREVCTNGAIAAHVLGSQRLERVESVEVCVPSYDAAVILSKLGDAVRAAAAPEAFTLVTNEMRAAADVEADMVIQVASMLARMPGPLAAQMVPHILGRFHDDGDRSEFGLMNAVTAVARDVGDAETRWRLEVLGGTLPAWGPSRGAHVPASESAHVGAACLEAR